MNNVQEVKFVQNLVREAAFKAGGPLELSVIIDASDKSIYKWMNAKSCPDAKHLIRILSYLNYLANQKAA